MPTAPKKKSTAKVQPATTAQPAKAVRSVAPQRPSARRAAASLASTAPFPAADLIQAIRNQPASADKPTDAFRSLIQRHLVSTLARHPASATSRDWWVATALAVRDTIHERMIATQAVHNAHNVRRIYYFSLEYLMGRLFGNNLIATGLLDTAKEALESLGQDTLQG